MTATVLGWTILVGLVVAVVGAAAWIYGRDIQGKS